MASDDVGVQAFGNVLPRRSTRRGPDARGSSFAARLGERRTRHRQRSALYRVFFAVAGVAVLLAGVAMLVLPGPGLLVTAAGLGMLALEFAWAERLLARAAVRLEAARLRAASLRGRRG
jgi:uncharacterized protein (TIGR02611 family)